MKRMHLVNQLEDTAKTQTMIGRINGDNQTPNSHLLHPVDTEIVLPKVQLVGGGLWIQEAVVISGSKTQTIGNPLDFRLHQVAINTHLRSQA